MAYIRQFKTTSGATGVQVIYKKQGEIVKTVHIGSATTKQGIENLKRKAQKEIDKGKTALLDFEAFDRKSREEKNSVIKKAD